MASFRVHFPSPDPTIEYGESASFAFNPSGHLVIRDGAGKRFTLAPGTWTRIEEDDLSPSTPTHAQGIEGTDMRFPGVSGGL